MSETDEERIYKKAHELWEAEGRPHGRDKEHWDQAKEIIALQDSAGTALLPRETGASEPVEERTIAIDNEGQAPSLTDTGDHDLTATDREPAITQPKPAAKKAAAKRTASSKTMVKSESSSARTARKPKG